MHKVYYMLVDRNPLTPLLRFLLDLLYKCHCHSLTLASVKSRLVLPFWYRLTRVVPDKGPLNVCVLNVCVLLYKLFLHFCAIVDDILTDIARRAVRLR